MKSILAVLLGQCYLRRSRDIPFKTKCIERDQRVGRLGLQGPYALFEVVPNNV